MSKEFEKDMQDIKIDKLQRQLEILTEMQKMYEKENKTAYDYMNIQKLQASLEAEGLKNINDELKVKQKINELDRETLARINEIDRIEEDIAKSNQQRVKEKEKEAKAEAELLEKEKQRAREAIDARVKEIQEGNRLKEIQESIRDIQGEILEQTKDKSDEEVKQALSSDERLKNLEAQKLKEEKLAEIRKKQADRELEQKKKNLEYTKEEQKLLNQEKRTELKESVKDKTDDINIPRFRFY